MVGKQHGINNFDGSTKIIRPECNRELRFNELQIRANSIERLGGRDRYQISFAWLVLQQAAP
jgi:hypothetical protein